MATAKSKKKRVVLKRRKPPAKKKAPRKPVAMVTKPVAEVEPSAPPPQPKAANALESLSTPSRKFVGMPMKRKEDPRLIQGLAHYVDDIQMTGMVYACVVRSPYAHAKIKSVDVSKARTAPGVVAVSHG